MPGFGFGSRRPRRAAGDATVPLSFTPGTLETASIRFPPENGSDPVSLATSTAGENGMLSLVGSSGSANLVSSSSRWLQSAGALVVVTTLPTLIYDGLNQKPFLGGTESFSAGARFFGLQYVPRVTGTDIGLEHRFLFRARGESAASANATADSAQVPAGVTRLLIAVRFDGSQFRVDLWDCDTGTRTAGTAVAMPTGWVGIQNLTYNVAVGGIRADRFPLMASSDTPQSINAWRGEIGLFAMLDTNPSDADLQAVALGADPWTTFGASNVRAGLLGEGSAPFPVVSNRSYFASANWTVHGTIYPGSRIRRQSPSTWFTVNRIPDPALVAVPHGQTKGRLPVSFRLGGVSGQIQVQVQDEDGSVLLPDWRNVVVATGSTASGAVELPFHPNNKAWRLRFRVPDGSGGYLHAEANTDVVVAYGCVNLGQSEMVRAVGWNVSNTGDNVGNPLGLTWSGVSDAGKYVFWTTWRTLNAGAGGGVAPVVRRSRFAPNFAGSCLILTARRLRQYTNRPLAFVDAAVAGTSAFELLNDAATARKWSDMETALNGLAGRDSSGRVSVSAIAMMWEAFWAGTNYKGQVLRPLVTGLESDPYVASSAVAIAQANINHWLLDGVTLDPRFRMAVMPANREVVTTGASATVDNHLPSGTKRATMHDISGISDVLVAGPECAVHAMEQGGATSITHPDQTRLTGIYPWCRKVADTYAIALGLLDWQRPTIASAALTGGGASIVVTVSGKPGDTLDTEGNFHASAYGDTPTSPIGLTVSGFEVQDGGSGAWTRSGFTATISSGNTITLARDSGTWAAGTRVRFNAGGPGSYLNNWNTPNIATEDAWVKSNPVFGGHEIAGGNDGVTAA